MNRSIIVAILLLLCVWPGWAAGVDGTRDVERVFNVRGVVVSLSPDKLTAVIRHEEVMNYMPAMTMPFHGRSTNVWAGITVGDIVHYQLHIDGESSWVERVQRESSEAKATVLPTVAASVPMSPVRPHHPLLDYKFTNEMGAPISFNDFRGDVIVYTFFFTRCPVPDFCPRLSRNFEEVSRKLTATPGAPTNWHLISVSFDPEHDRPEVLKEYAARYHSDSQHWSFLTGASERIAELAQLSDANYTPEAGLYTHNFRTLVIDPRGRLQMSFPIGGDISDAIVEEILKAAAAESGPPSR